MSLVRCRVRGCDRQVRQGLKRFGEKGVAGQELADGETCWRCRRKHAALDKKMGRKKK